MVYKRAHSQWESITNFRNSSASLVLYRSTLAQHFETYYLNTMAISGRLGNSSEVTTNRSKKCISKEDSPELKWGFSFLQTWETVLGAIYLHSSFEGGCPSKRKSALLRRWRSGSFLLIIYMQKKKALSLLEALLIFKSNTVEKLNAEVTIHFSDSI